METQKMDAVKVTDVTDVVGKENKATYNEVWDAAVEYNSTLEATDPRFVRDVFINTDDGSSFKWNSAFMCKKDDWIVVFTEHYGIHVFDEGELIDCREYYPSFEEIEEL